MNPCPCGYYNHPKVACTCPPGAVLKYMNKVSGPLLDRIDIHIEVAPLTNEQLMSARPGESSATIRERVIAARAIQTTRFAEHPGIHCNAQMNTQLLQRYCVLDSRCQQMMSIAMDRMGLSARAYDRILKVARTIADLDGATDINHEYLAEAITYRSLDRDSWGK